MPELIEIVYIGDKDCKADTVTGSRLVFPRLTPVAVDTAIAFQLLRYPAVWVRAEQVPAVLEAHAQAVAEQQARAEQEATLAAARAAEASMEVAGMDLTKYSSAKLATLAEKYALGIEQGAQESVEAYRLRVRDALRNTLRLDAERTA